MNIPKQVIDKKKSMPKIKKFNVKWTFKDKIIIITSFKFFKYYIYIWKFSMHFTNKFLI